MMGRAITTNKFGYVFLMLNRGKAKKKKNIWEKTRIKKIPDPLEPQNIFKV